MTSRTATALFAAAAALSIGAFVATPAQATLFTGSIQLVDNTKGNPLDFSGSGTINWNETTLNTWTHYDAIMSYTLDPTKLGLYNDEIQANLDFALPAAQLVKHTGDASDAVFSIFGFIGSGGAITWDKPNPFTIDFTTGDEISLQLDSGVFGQGGYKNTGVLSVEVEQTKVPEPMSLALLGAGLAGLGIVSRRRSRLPTAAA